MGYNIYYSSIFKNKTLLSKITVILKFEHTIFILKFRIDLFLFEVDD